jgi:hypothetical protein
VFIGHDHIWERSTLIDDYLVGGGTGQTVSAPATS